MNNTIDPFDSFFTASTKPEPIDFSSIAKTLQNLNDTAFDFIVAGNIDSAQESLQSIATTFTKNPDGLTNPDFRLQQGRYFNILGVKHWMQQQFHQAFLHYTTALEIFEILGNDRYVALVCNNIANLQRNLGNYKSAIDYFKISVEKLEVLDDEDNLSKTYLNLGILYQTLDLSEFAEETLLKALHLAEKINHQDTIASCYQHLSIQARRKKEFELSQEFALKALEIFRQFHNKVGEIETMSSLANNLYAQGLFEDSINKYFEIIAFANEPQFKSQLANTYFNIAGSLQALLIQQKPLPALEHDYGHYAQLAYSIADEQDDIALKADACKVLAEYNDSKSSFEQSVQYYKEYLLLLKEQQRNESKASAEQFQLETTLAALEKKSLLEQATLKATNDLLFKVVPEPVAKRLISGETPIADYIPSLSVIFTDMVGFTSIAKSKEPSILVSELNETFSQIDRLAKEYSIEKIKTIGDAYMAVSFDLPNEEHHSCRIIRFALAIIDSVKTSFQFRVGIHSGPVVAGVIGLERFSYDLWGDTVNVAQRLEATSETSTVHISEQTYLLVKDTFECKFVGKTALKGIGLVNTYHVIREKLTQLT